MQKIFLLLTLTLNLLSSIITEEVTYESGISIYGKVGYVNLKFQKNTKEGTYHIQATTTSHGVVKYLSNNRVDIFTSEGKIRDGIYIPLKFTKSTSKTDYNKTTVYAFDYENNTVFKTKTISKYKIISTFNAIKFAFDDERKLFIEENSEYIDLASNDYLSLYLNLIHGNLKTGKIIYVDKKDKDTLILVKNDLFEVQKNFGEDSYHVSIKEDTQSIFFEEVRSIGIAFYGDAYIKKISRDKQIKN